MARFLIPHWAHHFLAIISKVHRVCTKHCFQAPTSARFLIAALGTPLLSDFQKSARVLKTAFSESDVFQDQHVFSIRTGCTTQQSAPVCTKQSFKPDFGTFSHCRTGHTTFERFSEKCTFSARDLDVSPDFLGIFSKINRLGKTLFSAQDQQLNSASAIISKVHQFCFKPDFSTFSAALGFKPDFRFEHFSHWVHHFLGIFSKINSVSSPTSANVFSLPHWAHLFSAQVHEFVENSVFSPRPGRFAIFALGAPLFRDFQQNKRVCTKHCFYHSAHPFTAIISKVHQFCLAKLRHVFSFRTGRILLQRLSAKCTSLYKTEFSQAALGTPLRQRFSALPHWAHHF